MAALLLARRWLVLVTVALAAVVGWAAWNAQAPIPENDRLVLVGTMSVALAGAFLLLVSPVIALLWDGVRLPRWMHHAGLHRHLRDRIVNSKFAKTAPYRVALGLTIWGILRILVFVPFQTMFTVWLFKPGVYRPEEAAVIGFELAFCVTWIRFVTRRRRRDLAR